MARFAIGDQSDADPGPPIDDTGNPPVAPASPPLTPPDDGPQTNQPAPRPVGSGFSDLGATSISATARPLTDAAPQTAIDQSAPVASSIVHQTNDLAMVQNNLLAEVNSGQFSGATLGHVQAILSDLTVYSVGVRARGESVGGRAAGGASAGGSVGGRGA